MPFKNVKEIAIMGQNYRGNLPSILHIYVHVEIFK